MHDAICAFVTEKKKAQIELLLPVPAAFEILRLPIYRTREQQEAVMATLSSEFEPVDFDHRAALEAANLWHYRMATVKSEYSADATARKLKADLMIVACAIAAGAGVLLSLDNDMHKWTDHRIEVIRPPIAGSLGF